jgi:hypothetical protein
LALSHQLQCFDSSFLRCRSVQTKIVGTSRPPHRDRRSRGRRTQTGEGATRHRRTGAILGNLAYITSESKVTGTFKSKPVNSVSIETMVLHKSPSGWKILHIHWSSRDAK